MGKTPLRLGEMLIEAGMLTNEQLEKALSIQKSRGLRLGAILLQEGFVGEQQLVQALSRRLSIPWVSLWHIDIPDHILQLVPANVAEEFFLIPIYVRAEHGGERALYVAMNDPTDDKAMRFVSASAGMNVKPMVAGPSDIAAAIRAYYYDEEPEESMPPPPVGRGSAPPPPPPGAGVGAPPPPVPPSPVPPAPPEPAVKTSKAQIESFFEEDDSAVPAPTEEIVEETQEEVVEETPEEVVEKTQEEVVEETPKEVVEESKEGAAEKQIDSADSKPVLDLTADDSESRQKAQREVEKHMFGVGSGKTKKGRNVSLTLLDGTTIKFGGTAKKGRATSEVFSKDDLIAGLLASASGTPMEDFLPSDKWEKYMAALLNILMRKHLVMFNELMDELKKKD
jgi:type IV pilus assembly protein PilB